MTATVASLKFAIARAREVDAQLVWGKFDWKPYLKGKHKPAETVAEWVDFVSGLARVTGVSKLW
ncbi:MAG TPA: hypothetical protein V6D34_10160 [Candidatus Sericytochromatia bacterium]